MIAPLPLNERDRLTALRDYQVLDTEAEAEFDDIVRVAACVFGVPTSLVSLIDKDRQWFKARHGMCERELDRDSAFCARVIMRTDPLIVTDAQHDPRFADNPLVTGPLNIRFYAGVPLIDSAGFALGSLCVVDSEPREPSADQIATLQVLASHVVTLLELRRSERKLADSLRESAKAQQALQRKRDTLEALVEIGHTISTEFDVLRIGRMIADAVCRLAPGRSAAFVYRLDYGQAFQTVVAGEDAPDAENSVADLVRWLEHARLPSGSGSPLDSEEAWLASVETPLPHCLGMLFQSGYDLPGGLFVFEDPANPFDARTHAVLRRLVSIAEVALSNAGLIRRLEQESRERLAAEREARYAVSHTDEVLASISSLLIVLNGDGRIIRWNETATRLLGLQPEHVVGRRLEDLPLRWQGPDVFEAYRAVLGGSSLQRLDDVAVRGADGAPRLLGISMTPLKHTGTKGVLMHAADISKRRDAEEALRRQQSEHRAVVENVSDVIFMVDGQGVFRFLNPAWERLTGYSPAESVGLAYERFVPTEDREERRRNFAILLAGGQPEKEPEFRLLHRDGGERWVQYRAQVVRDAEGRPTGVTGTLRDMTDLRLAEAAEDVHRRFEQVLTSISTRFINLDPDEVDQEIANALGQVAEFIRMDSASLALLAPGHSLYRIDHEWGNGRLRPRVDRPGWQNVPADWVVDRLLSEEPWFGHGVECLPEKATAEQEFVHAHGWGSWISLRLMSRGQFFGWVTFASADRIPGVTDTTLALLRVVSNIFANTLYRMQTDEQVRRLDSIALAETESRLQTVVTHAPIILLSLDAVGLFTLAEGKGLEPLGLDPGQMVGLFADDILKDEVELRDALALAVGGDAFTREIAFGGLCFESHFRPLYGEGGKLQGTIGVLIDVTKRKELESQLQHVHKMESIGNLSAGIAHEINTPIQFVDSNLQFVGESLASFTRFDEAIEAVMAPGLPPEKLTRAVERCREIAAEIDYRYLCEEVPVAVSQSLEGVQRVTQIVRSMKEFSHPGTTEKVSVDLNRLIESTITVCRNEWKYVADVVTDFDPGLEPVLCLPGDFNQAVLNIIVNAAHAIESVVGSTGDKGTIRVSTQMMGREVEIRISDSGTGIPEAIRSRIFDPFFTTKEVGRGTGQGLSIVHSVIVNRHGGSVAVESSKERGTTFVLKMPLLTTTSTGPESED